MNPIIQTQQYPLAGFATQSEAGPTAVGVTTLAVTHTHGTLAAAALYPVALTLLALLSVVLAIHKMRRKNR